MLNVNIGTYNVQTRITHERQFESVFNGYRTFPEIVQINDELKRILQPVSIELC